MVVAVDGASRAPIARNRLLRVLRRVLLATAVTAAGWLLTVLFSGTASASPDLPSVPESPGAAVVEEHTTPPDAVAPAAHEPTAPAEPVEPSPGLVGGVLGGVSSAVDGVATTVNDVLGSTTSLLPTFTPPQESGDDSVPGLIPSDEFPHSGGSSTSWGGTTTKAEPVEPAAATDPAAVVPAAAPPAATPAPGHAIVELPAPRPAPVGNAAPGSYGTVGNETGSPGSEHTPNKTPLSPSSTVSVGYDHSGGLRGTHGVLVAQTTFEPPSAGFTTRSRALSAGGRDAGLPASSPD